MGHGRVQPIFDAVHGSIDLDDADIFRCEDILPLLLESRHVQRLRRLKLLPFGMYRFLAADHTRFAHAVGSAHTALRIMQRLHRLGFFSASVLASLRTAVPALADRHSTNGAFIRSICEHVVVTALLQDIGELPYKAATDLFFYPHPAVLTRVSDELELDASHLSSKDAFTLYGIIDLFGQHELIRTSFDMELLCFLVTGGDYNGIRKTSALSAIRQTIDGVIDADRLDYVHRDAYHTIGGNNSTSVDQVVGTLLTYDEHGPIFSAVGPVSNFLMLRAILRSQVYSAPENRFRITLLAGVLSELLKRHTRWMDDCFDAPLGALTSEAFFRLDDVSFLAALRDLRGRRESAQLDHGVRRAIDLMSSHGADYEYYWLDRPATHLASKPVKLRSDIYVDTYWDYENHKLYSPGSVRIQAKPYELIGETIPLEATGGHVSEFLQKLWDSPVQNKVLFFVPTDRTEWFIQLQRRDGDAIRGLYRAAIARDAQVRLSVVDDTRNDPRHTGPSIFVSFCWEDIDAMRAVLRLLHDRRRRYFSFVGDFHGLGGDTRQNGAHYASQAEASILLVSRSYVRHARDTTGNIYAELLALGRRLVPSSIVPLTVDLMVEYEVELKSFPWAIVGFSQAPFLGAPIGGASIDSITIALDAALARIDAGPQS